MRFCKYLFCAAALIFAGCTKTNSNNAVQIVEFGRLEPKGSVTYSYGQYLLVVDTHTSYLVEGTSVNLESFLGDSVKVVMVDMNYRQNAAPELFNVLTVNPQ